MTCTQSKSLTKLDLDRYSFCHRDFSQLWIDLFCPKYLPQSGEHLSLWALADYWMLGLVLEQLCPEHAAILSILQRTLEPWKSWTNSIHAACLGENIYSYSESFSAMAFCWVMQCFYHIWTLRPNVVQSSKTQQQSEINKYSAIFFCDPNILLSCGYDYSCGNLFFWILTNTVCFTWKLFNALANAGFELSIVSSIFFLFAEIDTRYTGTS